MADTSSSFSRRLRLLNLIRGLIVVVGVVVIVAAFAAGRVVLGIVAMAVVGVGIPVAFWVTRTREALRGERPSP